MKLETKRIYEPKKGSDGTRVLVDRLWPRGVSKEESNVELWLKELGPSTELRKWFNHDPAKWAEFKRRYWSELKSRPEPVQVLKDRLKKGKVTLVFGSKEQKFNNAEALKEFLEKFL